ncbi:hypothetical protein [Sphingobacterium thalpophilum]|uniref:hypothetical protein n=1 Tax=Sphingobacterium thalpophilum TaxID=259 RepID=UPI0024A76623|nr:hypothetical protein [Sphingobacterium thalpophilum]
MIKQINILTLLLLIAATASAQDKDSVKTTFQSSREWRPTIDNRADAVMIYGTGGNPSDKSRKVPFEQRVKSWRDRGYITHFMTGIAWGEYQDYFTGKWDGKMHLDEGQVDVKGDTIWHGHMVPYIVPTDNYLKYIKEMHIKRVIDAGIDAIFMEEPEFWARAGYSEAFKKEWKKFYGFEWRAQHESPENTYLSNKLKYALYLNALKEVFSYAKAYGKTKGMDVKCYVPTHSLINYSQWMIVSPEASLATLPCVDGYIAQVWTGTSREPNYFNGIARERVFETAFLEYGVMESMTAPTGRKMFFLTDPIEDWPRDWADYKKNYQATFTAQLLYPNIANYEVMPWPERIYEGLYKTSPHSDQKEKIPRHYSTQMQVMINSLTNMPKSANKVSGSTGISVLLANSLMFQRFPSHADYDDPQLANFYGLALPLLKNGVPVNTVHLENIGVKNALADTKILLMSYSNMKPLAAEAHQHIADWVKNGGILLYCGTDNDPFQSVQEWWNTKGNHYQRPSDHLFEKMGVSAMPKEGTYRYGKGTLHILRADPKEFVVKPNNSGQLLDLVKQLYDNRGKSEKLQFKNYFTLTRGVYDLIAVLDESVSSKPYEVRGNLIDLFDPNLPIITSKKVQPNEQCLFVNIDRVVDKQKPQVLASASRIYNEVWNSGHYAFLAKSPANTTNISRILLPGKPKSLLVDHKDVFVESDWDARTKTYLLRFENNPDGVQVDIKW